MCYLWFTGLFFSPYIADAQGNDSAYVVLVSFDGFRNDYVEKFDAPNFKKFIKNGTAATGLIPSYPSKTFPNHYTIVTGMYPGHHGLVDNSFYDKTLNRPYSTSNRTAVENPVFYGGLPLWQLAQQNGLKAASYFWVGSEAPVQGQYPDYFYIYDGKVPNEQRVDQTIQWLQMPDSGRPNFISLYFSLIDDAGHTFGPNAVELGREVLAADQILGRLMAGLDTLPLPVHVILVSDHGMLEMQPSKKTYILLEDLPGYADSSLVWVNNGTHVHVYSKTSENLDGLALDLQAGKEHFAVWEKKNLPNQWHYKHPRVGDLLLVAEPGFYFTSKTSTYWKKTEAGESLSTWGTHGFDPGICPEMYGIFYAKGPNIQAGKTIPAFENIHIYPLITALLRLPNPEIIDGKPEVLSPILRN